MSNHNYNPRKSQKNSSKNNFQTTFMDFKLNAENQEKAREFFRKNFSNVGEGLYALITNFYKVSIQYDNLHNCFMMSVTGKSNSLNPDICQTTRSDNILDLIAFATFKALEYFPDGVWDTAMDTWMLG